MENRCKTKVKMEEINIKNNLPNDVLEHIIKHLPLKDFLNLRIICRSWNDIISKAVVNKRCRHLVEIPLVFAQYVLDFAQYVDMRCFYSFLWSEGARYCKTPLLGPMNRCHGSIEGWLIVSDYSEKTFATFFLLNPVTNKRIVIPSKYYFPSNSPDQCDKKIFMGKMVASSNPCCDGADCILVGLSTDCCHIVLYKFYDDSWTMIEPDDSYSTFIDVEVIGKKVYVSTARMLLQSILVYDVDNCTTGSPKAEFLAYHPRPRSLEPRPYTSFLARDEALKYLYIIHMFDTWERKTRDVNTFQVFKLEVNNHVEWQIANLKDKVVFVSGLKSIVMLRDKFAGDKELIEENCVYFTLNSQCSIYPKSGLQLGKFCFTDSRIKYFPVETTDPWLVPSPVWFLPSVW
ncbi:F-box protein [Trifolium medium]|uniref:F-box protein n=1 Tax=Trifolium medium TaxID=97028 RepID=A0A392LXR4_9FABA|nr:F-box protein [Trifolium medium]